MDDKEHTVSTIAQLVKANGDDKSGDNKFVPEDKGPADKLSETKVSIVTASKPDGGYKNKIYIRELLRRNNMLVIGSDLGRDIQDDYRRIKRPLVSNACGRNKSMLERGNIILVTSSLPGEGKTYTAMNLALSMVHEIDNTVLLVDCDAAKFGVSQMLGVEKKRGLIDVLEDDSLDISDVILQTDIPNLRVIPAGGYNEILTELLASQRMADLTSELADRYSDRIVVFDGPPMLATPHTQILAGLVGQIVFVVEAGKTSQSLVEEALGLIPEEQATGVLLNKNQGIVRRNYYYGYYGEENRSVDEGKED